MFVGVFEGFLGFDGFCYIFVDIKGVDDFFLVVFEWEFVGENLGDVVVGLDFFF